MGRIHEERAGLALEKETGSAKCLHCISLDLHEYFKKLSGPGHQTLIHLWPFYKMLFKKHLKYSYNITTLK